MSIFRETQIHPEPGIQKKSERSFVQNSPKACKEQCVFLGVFWWGADTKGREELQWEQGDFVLRGGHAEGTANSCSPTDDDPEGHRVPSRGEGASLYTWCQERTSPPPYPQNTHTPIRPILCLQPKEPGAAAGNLQTQVTWGVAASCSAGGSWGGVRQWWHNERVSSHSSH